MINNFVNRHDLVRVMRRFSRGQVGSILGKLKGSRKERVLRQWGEVDREPRQWWTIPAVRRRWNSLVTGDEAVDFPAWVASEYLCDRQGLRALSLGCGTGERELRWARLGVFEQFDAFDITPEVIEVARANASEAGLGSKVNFEVQDFADLDGSRQYDVIIAEHSLHHLDSIPEVVKRIEALLAPSGLFVLDEFVGPRRFQWSDAQVAEATALLRSLPEKYRRLPSGKIKGEVDRPSVLWMLLTDPSEAIDSERILPSLREQFDVIAERPYGGTLLHIVLSDISQNFNDDPESIDVLRRAFEVEDTLMAQGRVGSDFSALVCRRRHAVPLRGADQGDAVVGEPRVLLDDQFSDRIAPGHVIGSCATNGARRLGSDRLGTLSVDNGQLRFGWMEYPGWGNSVLAYGPFRGDEPLVLAVRALNGLTTSQSDWRAEGRRALLRRLRATLLRGPIRRPEIRENMVVGWFGEQRPKQASVPVAAVFHRAGDAQAGELWFQAGANRVMLCDGLQNIPANLVVTLRDGMAVLNAWSYPAAHCYAEPGDLTPLAALSVGPLPERLYAVIHQPILGEVFYRVDTRIDRVQVIAAGDELDSTLRRLCEHRWWDPAIGPVCFEDHFEGSAGELGHDLSEAGSPEWERLLGEGVFERTGSGGARVRASREEPNPGRTIYGVPWSDPHGANLSMDVTPPGTARGQGHRGRSGVAFWQDEDNHFIVNTWIDDAMVGVSLSAFLRIGGREEMFEWDAVWTNVGSRVSHGVPFRLSVSCDGTQFLCRLDGEPVMYRAFTDYRADYGDLRIRSVGIVANWEWGDDTGSRLGHFSARPLLRAETRSQ